MNVKNLILKKLEREKELTVFEVTKETGFSRAYINRFFRELRAEGKIMLLGKANLARYVLASKKALKWAKEEIWHFQRALKNKNLSENIVLNQIKIETGIFIKLPENVSKILDYAFTEMLNNAIEHSRSPIIKALIKRDKNNVFFVVNDSGIGVFRNIMKKFKLDSELEAIQDLLKGKHTTSPRAHTGEGIFFTSKIADRLSIKSFGKELIFDNKIDDIAIKNVKPQKGTRVEFIISTISKRKLSAIFKEYSNDAFEFDKTLVTVELYKMGADFISRSQARRILSGLDKFKKIILDFKDVDTVGQAFADEVFRVWKTNYPGVAIEYRNANENIEFMIRRALRN